MNKEHITSSVYDFAERIFPDLPHRRYGIAFTQDAKHGIVVNENDELEIRCGKITGLSDKQVTAQLIHEYTHCIQIDNRMDLYKVNREIYPETCSDFDAVKLLFRLYKDFNRMEYRELYLHTDDDYILKSFLEGSAFYFEELYKGTTSESSVCRVAEEYICEFERGEDLFLLPYVFGYLSCLILEKHGIDWQHIAAEEKKNTFDIISEHM